MMILLFNLIVDRKIISLLMEFYVKELKIK